MTRVLVPLADGCEEMEAVIIIDTLRRARWEVVSAGFKPGPVTASRGVRLLPDADWSALSLDSFDALVLPGGAQGTRALMANPEVLAAVRRFHAAKKVVAAVCAGPLVLQAAGVLEGRGATCHPGVAQELKAGRRAERVVVDGSIVTSQGPGTSFEFALALIRLVSGPAAADEVAAGLIL